MCHKKKYFDNRYYVQLPFDRDAFDFFSWFRVGGIYYFHLYVSVCDGGNLAVERTMVILNR